MIDFFVKTYGKLHNYNVIPFWVLTPFRRIIRYSANLVLPSFLSNHFDRKYKQDTEIIVSLTSFPARINDVWQVVECMLRQSYRPKHVFLWLSREQFKSENDIPLSLRNLEGDIFRIRLVDEDIRSHKKYYYVIQEFPNSLILLIDDDIYYPTDMIERLYNVHLKNPKSIICQYGYFMKYNQVGGLMPYKQWKHVNTDSDCSTLFFGSGGGTLFLPSLLYDDLLKKELFLTLTPKADDIWLNAMTRLANVPIKMLKPRLILPIKCSGKKVTLCSENISGGGNDSQLEAVTNYYINKLDVNPFDSK